MNVLRITSSIALLLACTACATHQNFRPAERALAETDTGHVAAEYDLRMGDDRWGEVRVWSEGATVHETSDGGHQTILHVGFEIENVTDNDLSLDLGHTAVEKVVSGPRELDTAAPEDTHGEPIASAHQVSQVHFDFVMPDGFHPVDMRGFRVRWRLLGPGDVFYEQYTPFVRERRRPRYRHYYVYDPWWSVGFHQSFAWCW